jgi:hypothetical protein
VKTRFQSLRSTRFQAFAFIKCNVCRYSAGTLRIAGVAWTLCGAQKGFRRFDVRAPRTRRVPQTGEWARNVPREKRLKFTVTPVGLYKLNPVIPP